MMKKMAAFTAAVALSAGALTAQAADVTLKMHTFLPPQAPALSKFFAGWIESIEKASNGRMEVKLYGGMSLGGKPPALVDQVQDGFVDIIWTLPGYTPGRFPAISAFELPFMVTDAEQTSQALQAYYEQNEAVQKEFADMHPLFFWTHDRGVVYSKDEPYLTLADFEGKKIRKNSKMGKALESLGAPKRDYEGGYQIWNPSGTMFQNLDCKEAGARAAADVLKKYGFTAYAGGRMD